MFLKEKLLKVFTFLLKNTLFLTVYSIVFPAVSFLVLIYLDLSTGLLGSVWGALTSSVYVKIFLTLLGLMVIMDCAKFIYTRYFIGD